MEPGTYIIVPVAKFREWIEEIRSMDTQIHGEWGSGPYGPDAIILEMEKLLS